MLLTQTHSLYFYYYFSLGRVPMNSCDFSTHSYSFDDKDGDFELHDFDTAVTHDVDSGMIDMMTTAQTVFREAWGSGNPSSSDGQLQIYTSPWSPPAWMKQPTWEDPKNATHAGKMTYSTQPTCLRDGVGPDSRYAASWAFYFSKFLTACKYSIYSLIVLLID